GNRGAEQQRRRRGHLRRHAVDHRQPHGQDLRGPRRGRHDPRDVAARHQGVRGRLRSHVLRPGVPEHRVDPVGDRLHRRRRRDPRVPGLPDRAAVREVLLPRGRLPARPRRAADAAAARRVDPLDHDAHVRPREREEVRRGLPLRRPPDGHAARLGRRAVDLLPRRAGGEGRGDPLLARHPAHRQDADARGLRLPPQPRDAVRLSRQRARLPRELPRDALQDVGDEVRAGSPALQGARRPLHPARRPRAELLDERRPRGRLLPGRPLLRGGRGRGGPLRPAARRRQRAGPQHAAPGRLGGQHPGLPRGREGRQGAPAGLRPPRLQELRPARADHPQAPRRGLRGHGQEPAARDRHRAREARDGRRVLHVAQALPERRLLLRPHLRGDGARGRHVPRDVRDPADQRLDRAVARDDRRPGAEDRPPAPDLHGGARAGLRGGGRPRL
ncbi:MAG: Citrate synthase (si), partial [uncultured Solirubrobacteraceae bacterium]